MRFNGASIFTLGLTVLALGITSEPIGAAVPEGAAPQSRPSTKEGPSPASESPSESQKQKPAPEASANEVFQQLAAAMRVAPYSPLDLDGYRDPVDTLRYLAAHADELGHFITSSNARERGLAVIVLSMSDSTHVSSIAALLEDKASTIPHFSGYGGLDIPKPPRIAQGPAKLLILSDPQSVRALASWFLRRRLGAVNMDYKLTTDAETFLAYWSSIKNYDELPSEWVLQFRLAKVWAQPMDPLKAKLLKVSPGVRGIIAANVSAFVQEVYSDEEIAKLLATDADKKVIKPFLDGTWRLPGMTLEEGPNSQKQYESRTAILRVLPQLLKSEDADWVYSRAKVGDLFPDYVIAASRLDSVKGVKWLEKAIPDEPNQVSRCRMLVALGQVGGPDVQAYVVDHYYTDNKLEYNVGGLQEEFVNEVVKLPTEKARPLLRALVQDPRFATLGWSATRAFAENCQIFLGKKPAEADAYLAIDYPAGIYDFEQRVQDRKEHPKETERVLQATREFQRFLLKSLMPSGSP